MKASHLLSGAFLAVGAQAQLGAYAQCGGPNWTGTTTCVTGYYCRKLFPFIMFDKFFFLIMISEHYAPTSPYAERNYTD